MKYAYFNSCSMPTTGKEYDSTLRAVFDILKIDIVDLKTWICCGSTMAHHSSRLLSLSLPLKNLSEVEKAGLNAIIAPCSACYAQFKAAQHEIEENPEIKKKVEHIIEYQFKGKVEVYHPLEVLARDDVISRMPGLVKRNLSGFKIACYYGCLLVRPPKVTRFKDECEYPMSMDNILKACGFKTIDWSYKTDCCGGSLSITKPEIIKKLSKLIFDDAKAAGADAIANPCIFCQMNLDSRQQEIEKSYGTSYRLPVLYFSQLVALALGVPFKKLMFQKHFLNPGVLLKNQG